jgi:hypothetical protein
VTRLSSPIADLLHPRHRRSSRRLLADSNADGHATLHGGAGGFREARSRCHRRQSRQKGGLTPLSSSRGVWSSG